MNGKNFANELPTLFGEMNLHIAAVAGQPLPPHQAEFFEVVDNQRDISAAFQQLSAKVTLG